MLTPTNIVGVLIILNTWTFMLFGFDKFRAEEGRWRIAESTLLGFAFFGGSAGAFLGRFFFRHKTRKEPFSSSLRAIAMVHFIGALGIAGWSMI